MGVVLRQSFKNTLIIYLGFLIGGLNTIVFYPNLLKGQYYGLVQYVFAASNLIMPLMAFGVHYTIVKFFSSYTSKAEKDKFLSLIILFPLIIALPIGFLWNYFHYKILSFFPEENNIIENYTIYIYIVALSCAYFEVFYAWSKVQMQSVFGNMLKELYNRVIACLLLGGLWLGWLSKEEFLIYFSYAYILRVVLMMLYAFKQYTPKLTFSLPNNFNEILRYSFYIILAGSASAVILDIDKVMIPGKEAFKVAAYYGVAIFIGSFIEAPSRAMAQILQPITAKTLNDDNTKEVLSLYKKSSINLLLTGGLFFILVNCNVAELFKIMPDKGYATGVNVVLMISLAKLSNMFLGNGTAIIANSKFYRIALPIGVGSALTVYFLNTLFFYDLEFGTDGLAMATLITFLTFNLFRLLFIHFKLKMNPFTNKTILMLILIIAFYFVFIPWDFSVGAWYIGKFAIHPIVNIILKSILIIPTYLIVVYKLKISEQINSVINNKLPVRFK